MPHLTRHDIKLLSEPRSRKHWVFYHLMLRGTSLAKIAKDAGISRSTIYTVWRNTYPKMERLIADALGLEPSQVFPERYQPNGLPIYRMGRPKKSTHKTVNKRHAERNGSAMGVA